MLLKFKIYIVKSFFFIWFYTWEKHFPKENLKKKATIQGRREGMSGFLLKILPDFTRVEILSKTL